jgi:hypothetical protein
MYFSAMRILTAASQWPRQHQEDTIMPRTKTARATAAEAAPSTPAEEAAPPAATAPAVAERPPVEGEERRPWPDVTEQKEVAVSPDGDKLRLLRSRKFNQMQIKADAELPDWARERLKADGWRDRVEDEGIYTKQLPPRPKPAVEGQEAEPAKPAWPTVLEAERLFEEIANGMRADRKMPPVRLGGATVAER